MEEPDFLDLHHFLANDIIRTREGGTGWMIDLALNAERYNPKTFLLKTKKCSENGSIVLEPALSVENYINPKSESSTGFFGMFKSNSNVSISESLNEDTVRTTILSESSAVSHHKYAFIKSTDATGKVQFRIAPNAGFGGSVTGSKSTSRSVEVSCEDLATKSIDFEDLQKALLDHKVNTSATNLKGENSLFVVTDVLVAGKISWEVKQNVESNKRGGGNVDVEPVTFQAEGGTSSQHPEEHKQLVNNAVLALKLAKISYDSQGKVVRMDKSGSFEGNYTLGPGTEEREGHTAITLLGSGENVRKTSSLIIRHIGQEGHQNPPHPIPLQNIFETGKHQEKFREQWHLPLKGLLVSRGVCRGHLPGLRGLRIRLPWKPRKKKKERVHLKKVSVTDVQLDNTYTCICNDQLDIPKYDDKDWVWMDCKQWRESLAKNELQVNVEFQGSIRKLTVDAEDPIFVIMHKMRDTAPWRQQVLWYKGKWIEIPSDTIKSLGIKDGDQLRLECIISLPSASATLREKSRFTDLCPVEPGKLYCEIISRTLQDLQSMSQKDLNLKISEDEVRQILCEELTKDEYGDAEISPEGFQQLMAAVGQKVEIQDILQALSRDLEQDSDVVVQPNVWDMMVSSFNDPSWLRADDLGEMCASSVDRAGLMNFRSLSTEEKEYMERAPSGTEAEDTEEDGLQDASQLKGIKLPTVSGFSESEIDEASKLLQGLFLKMTSEKPEIAEKVSDVDWEAVNRRRVDWSEVQLAGLDDLGEGDKYTALGLLRRQISDKGREKNTTVSGSAEEMMLSMPHR